MFLRFINQLGQMSQIDLGNGVITQYKYHGIDSLDGGDSENSYEWGKPYQIKTWKDATVLLNQKYRWDAAGNMSSREDEVAAATESFSYDFLDRLTGVSGPYTESYAYDALGNITSKNSVSYLYSARPHAVTTVGSYVLSYDANGNMTGRANGTGTQTLSWNAGNQLSSVEGTGGSYSGIATYVYDGDGRRILKTEGGDSTVYVNKYYDKNLTDSEQTLNYYLGDKLVAFNKGGTLEYVHQDSLGSTSVSRVQRVPPCQPLNSCRLALPGLAPAPWELTESLRGKCWMGLDCIFTTQGTTTRR